MEYALRGIGHSHINATFHPWQILPQETATKTHEYATTFRWNLQTQALEGPHTSPPMNEGDRMSQYPYTPPPSLPTRQHTPQLVPVPVKELPVVINAKQSYRILKRRFARENLKLFGPSPKPNNIRSYDHAKTRLRGKDGRFLSTEEIAEMDRTRKDGGEKSQGKGTSSAAGGSHSKRKADTDSSALSKRQKVSSGCKTYW